MAKPIQYCKVKKLNNFFLKSVTEIFSDLHKLDGFKADMVNMGLASPFLYGYFSLKMVLMFFHDTRGSIQIGAGASGLISSGWGNRCLWGCGTTHEGFC